ncbi:MAG: hypothetical protein KA003_05985 [Caldilineaceae bacterium]|nr:hypothetical protein [Caldilineaceae bacterium]
MKRNHHSNNPESGLGQITRKGVGHVLGVAGVGLGLMMMLILALASGMTPAQASGLAEERSIKVADLANPALVAPLDPQVIPWTLPANAYRVSVKDDGIYELSYAYLQTAGLPVDTLDPRTFRMHFMGQEIRIQVTGQADGRFDASDAVIFYGRNVDTLYYDGLFASNKYVNELVYFLSYGAGNGLRMETVTGAPTAAPAQTVSVEHILDETNYWYFSEFPPLPVSGGDHWFGQWIQPRRNNVSSSNIRFTASDVDATVPGRLSMTLQGYAAGPHFLRLYLNDTQVYSGTSGWDDFGDIGVTMPITPGLFVNGLNTVKVELANLMDRSYDKVYINMAQIDFPRQLVAIADSLNIRGVTTGTWTFAASGFSSSDVTVYNVTDPNSVGMVINGTPSALGPAGSQQSAAGITFGATVTPKTRLFLAAPSAHKQPVSIISSTAKTSVYTPVDLLANTNRYDYIIITHGDFWDEMQPLARYRSFFYDVAMVDAQEIYNNFNGGMMSAEAIRDFLAYAYNNWSGAQPEFVLLVGDGAVDMRNYKSVSPPTFMPPFLVMADPYLGETAADNRFVLLAGNDLLPDMAIGRFPAGSEADVVNMVKKTLDYEINPPADGWTNNVLFISDDLEGGGGDFYGYSDILVSGFVDAPTNTIPYLPPSYSATRAYLGKTCDLANESPATGCRTLISETLNITGAMLVSYIGHSSRDVWGLEYLMDGQLVSGLNNSQKLPVILAMTCLEGSFHDSSVLSLAESYMRSSGGAVASWSPTGLGVATGHDYLEQSFFKNLFQNGITELGRLTVLAKQDLHEHDTTGRFEDLIDTYLLFGDPALRLQTFLGPTAVEMAGLDAVAVGDTAFLAWQTASEANIAGFNVMRASVEPATGALRGAWAQINPAPIPSQAGGTPLGLPYTYADANLAVGMTYRYSLDVIKTDGTVERYGLTEAAIKSAQSWRIFLPVVDR